MLKTSASALAIAIVSATGSGTVYAQTQANETTGEETVIEEIVVTGSRLARSARSASVPIAAVTEQNYKLAGALNAEDLLNTMPQFVPATTAASNSLASATGTGAATLDLRGLGATRNLVLVNGRRFVFFDGSQVTNINAIPTALIERTEVVTGGSSAVYGSDAIAGVVNFILRDDFEGIEARAQGNLNSRGDGFTNDITLTAGGNFADGRGNAVISVNYFKRDPILTDERSFSDGVLGDVTIPGQAQRELGVGGSSFVPNGRFSGLPFTDAALAARPGLAEALAAANLSGLGADGFIPGNQGQSVRPFARPDDLFDYSADNFLQVPQERWSINSMAHYDLNDHATGYLEGHFSNNRTTVGFASSFINASMPFEVDNPFLSPELRNVLSIVDSFEAGAAANDGLVALNPNRRLSEVGPRRNEDNRDAWRVVVGLRGDLPDLGDSVLKNIDYDLYYSFARTENTQTQIGNVSLSAFREGVLSGSGGPDGAPIVNPFGPNINQAGIDFIAVDSVNIDVTELQVASANLTADLFELPAGVVRTSFGAEWRSSSVNFNPDRLLEIGDVAGFNPITATAGSIEVWELFAEARIPILRDAPLIESLDLNSAVRYSDYDLDNVGAVWTYLGGVDWRVNGQIAFGGQFQRAIRAPNVGEAFGGQRQFPVNATDPCATAAAATDAALRDLCIASGVPANLVGNAAVRPNPEIPGLFGGNPDLEEERSDTITFGAILTPDFAPGLRISLDYFDIEVKDAISPFAGGVNNILDLCFNQIRDINSPACQAIARNPENGIIQSPFLVNAANANIGRLETSGVDLQVTYSLAANWGLFGHDSSFDVSLNGTWTDSFKQTPIADLPDNVDDCLGLFGPTCGEPKAEFRTTSRVTWTSGKIGLSARHRWIDGTGLDVVNLPLRRGEAAPAVLPAVTRFGSEHYLDLSFTYDLSERINLWGGANNVLDNGPPLLGANQRRANTFPDTFDAFGTQFFLGASVAF
ncbi:TonB-dependent receptor [Iodidimonas nitroreducens]|uniref:TonB-dependent receptor n=1 Tax=Iodidimonas nitroreducens TaxID=1236968 RepID=A0A5A7NBS7_9PROT|nr:TonB-dependent receptor [Iodidimonas nitroreducens]GAK32723.1 vitamin B12 transporter BtuB [alpha proteobacterium Q-1]GER04940.1 TonB-dependent receptor [Iodidimonas nitroreducens]